MQLSITWSTYRGKPKDSLQKGGNFDEQIR